MNKLLSVIIPCYNHGEYILDALESIRIADIHNICEIIIINDGSNDQNTLEILNAINSENLKIIHQDNAGLANARNRGIKESNCDYLLMLDSDNRITPEFLDSFHLLINQNQVFDMLHGDAIYFGERDGIFKSGELNIFKIFRANYIDACSIIKKECIVELGQYDSAMPYMGWEDWDLWVRMALNDKKTVYQEKIFFHYRYLNNSMIRSIGHKEEETKVYLMNKYQNHLFDDQFLNDALTKVVELNINRMGIKSVFKILYLKIKGRLSKKVNSSVTIDKLWY